jgi:hypothetical protein
MAKKVVIKRAETKNTAKSWEIKPKKKTTARRPLAEKYKAKSADGS